jgi:TonB family protein
MGLRRVVLVAVFLLARESWAQIDAHAVEQEMKVKKVALRSYSAEPVARYGWTSDKLVAVPGHVFTLGIFATRSVKLRNGLLVFEGIRSTLVHDPQNNQMDMVGESPMRLEVDLHNPPAKLTWPILEEMLFYKDGATLAAGLPVWVTGLLPADVDTTPKDQCECTRIFDRGEWIKLGRKDPQFTVPKLAYSVEPEFTEEARKQKMAGTVSVVIYIDNTGHVGDVWLAHALGSGLDDMAAKAVRQYVFDPATYAGRPVGSVTTVGVSFQVF